MREKSSHFRDEFGIVPKFMVGLAAICYAAMLLAFLFAIPNHVPNAPPYPFLVLLGIVGGAAVAAYLLLVGYVNQDAKRRDMGQLLWTLLVICIPYGFGFLAYFLLRKPILEACPKCGDRVERGFHYCARCGCALIPSCVHCGQAVQRDFVCCPYCGKTLAAPTA
ncbi:MAG TPA: zinc ribbon domain-containing protein [Candidatus Angelobacter sp.]|jgi:peptidoglycan/LPS O-acetylase OafA/YrhL|nr:zinc ribbon domain-containing protein [Candidatus Angelobacter sp.]